MKESGSGFVTRFEFHNSYLDTFEVEEAGGQAHLKYWIPTDEMNSFNSAIVGQILITQEFH